VLLPEFILSKAVCDLRLALHDLSEFETTIQEKYNNGFKEVLHHDFNSERRKIVRYWKWHAEYGRVVRFLFRLMALGRPPTILAEEDSGVRMDDGDDENGSNTQSTRQHSRLLSPSASIEMDELGSLHIQGAPAVQHVVTRFGEKTTPTDTDLRVADAVGNPSTVIENWSQQDKALSDAAGNKGDQTTDTGGNAPEGSAKDGERHVGGVDNGAAKVDIVQTRDSDQDFHGHPTTPTAPIEPDPREHRRPPRSQEIVITYSILQHWTLTHAYLANMGGLLHTKYYNPCLAKDTRYVALTGRKLSRNYTWITNHPLRGLILSKDDIDDRSKADFLVKAIAVVQISWLLLTLLARAVLSLPVTQLEIATAAFAIFAIATYAATFWKPKDVSQPILLPCEVSGTSSWRTDERYDWSQSFFGRLLAPATTHQKEKNIRDTDRIKNDVVWMPRDTQRFSAVPLVFVLMAISSFMFGGLHCLAWNFEFPSQTELILWRVASVASSIIPILSLLASLLLHYLATIHIDNRLMSGLLVKLECVAQFPPGYLARLKEPVFRNWPQGGYIVLMLLPAGRRSYGEKPSSEAVTRAEKKAERIGTGHDYSDAADGITNFPVYLANFFKVWENARNGVQDPRALDKLSSAYSAMRYCFPDKAKEFWDDYEDSYLRKEVSTADRVLPHVKCISSIMDALKHLEEEKAKAQKHRDILEQISRFQTISGGILYICTRLIIIVLIFTALRSVPVGVYENTPWTRLLPNFS
jgi:hypothetical protein